MGKQTNKLGVTPLWQDKKRWMGMPISFTKYIIDEERLYIQAGLFKTETDEILLYRILDIKSSRTLWQKICGVGTITLFCADQSSPTIELKNVKEIQKLHRFISDIVENQKANKGIVGREMFGAAGTLLGGINGHNDCDGDGICDTHDVTTFENFS